MNNCYTYLFLILLLAAGSGRAFAQNEGGAQSMDQIVAIVNDHIILKSEIDQYVSDYMMRVQQQNNQNISFSKDLWYQVLQNTVERFVLLDNAREDSVVVTAERVDQEINSRINQYVTQLGSEQALERQLGKSIVQIRADLRENYRQEMIVGRYRQQKRDDITITRPEVVNFFEQIPKDSLPTIPEQVALSQIVKLPPPNENAADEALQLALQLRDSIVNHNKSIEELAQKYSDGPSASSGGRLPMTNINDLVPEYSAAASALEQGEISEVVKTSFGYHIIRLNKREGDQIDTNHILIRIDQESYNSQAAIDSLTQFRDSVLNHGADFAELARNYSEDPNTAPRGGRILNPQTRERLLPLSQLDPALYRIALLLEEEGAVSEPKPFTMGSGNNTRRAYRIVHLDEHVQEHVANLEQDYERIKSWALNEKQYRELRKWISELKNEVYIEYKIPVPAQYRTY